MEIGVSFSGESDDRISHQHGMRMDDSALLVLAKKSHFWILSMVAGSNFPGLTMSRAFGDTACVWILVVLMWCSHFFSTAILILEPIDFILIPVRETPGWNFPGARVSQVPDAAK